MAGSDRRHASSQPERAMSIAAVKLLAVLAVPVIGVAWSATGGGGALGAAAGLLLVLVLFGLTGLVLSPVRDAGPAVVVGVSLAGLGLRIVGYAAALGLLATIDGLHRPSLAAATALAFVVTLAYEIRVVSRTPGFFWVRTTSG